ncbi:PAS domain-containing sensor histidine kinase [Iodidimonas gelatinilytica]|uniref:histidine kinase n=1 Tax=Iodidimonas gelatinilytica TaxID=1236966 RepID=A0A5A7MNL0_9PROT|nr:PAS domain-containing sensor histidine kinase [Iodidimonas gelatinilytica]GEQ96733.1 PAS domain-containing sensor histidine kinase [Iodidimonas gelatinilytica]
MTNISDQISGAQAGPEQKPAGELGADPASVRHATRRMTRLRLWARRVGLGLKLEIALAVVAVGSGIATYIALSRKGAATDVADGLVATLLLINLMLLVSLAFLVARRVVRVWFARKEGSAGSRLHLRLVALFAAIAAVPPVIMAVLSVLFLQYGVQNWFSDSVRGALNNSLEVADAYIEEHRQNIKLDLIAMANDLNQAAPQAERDRTLLQTMVQEQALFRSLQEVIVFTGNGRILAKYSFNLDLSANRVPETVMQRVSGGEQVVIADPGDDQVRALTRLDGFYDAFLYVGRRVDPRVTAHVEAARRAVETYRTLEGQRSSVQFRSNAIFIVVTLLILLAAVWIGLWFANRLVAPISRLVEAANRIRQGDLTARAEGPGGPDEIGVLSRTFNRMTRKLEAQRRELVSTNRELDDRRSFLETVLEGVSAGVFGVTVQGVIHLPNRSACDLLGLKPDDVVGTPLHVIAPQMGPLLDEAAKSMQGTAQAQITVMRKEQARTLLVRVAAEADGKTISGFVVTFDDVTDQLRDQRTAAWADVARRIAHEIKNPLTPIQLSAERLRRKYEREVVTDPGVFTQCTDTIIRQVGDLRRMVDEFSSFARMPAPSFREENLRDIVRQTVFLQEMGNDDIRYHLSVPDEAVELVCDGRLLAQALTNLLKNAHESISGRISEGDRQPGEIAISLTQDEDTVTLAVCDNGRGLPEDRDRLVEPYVTTRAKGTGLGLAIVNKIAEEHGGTLILANAPKGGAIVSLCFSTARLRKKLSESKKQDAYAAQ